VHVVPIKTAKHLVEVTAQHVKLTRVPLRYPALFVLVLNIGREIVFRKIEVQKMFHIKTNPIALVVSKPSKLHKYLLM
jgi:hypothetical protein